MERNEIESPEHFFEDYFFEFALEVCGDRLTIWNEDDIVAVIDRTDKGTAVKILTGIYDDAAKHKRRKRRKNIKQTL